MRLVLTCSQAKTLADFCSDVAKGVTLAVILGQGTLQNVVISQRVLLSLVWVLIALLMLYFALIFSQETKKYESN